MVYKIHTLRGKCKRDVTPTELSSLQGLHDAYKDLTWKFYNFHAYFGDIYSISLIHCGLVTPYGEIDLGQHWLRQWLVAWQHQAITWTNVDLSSGSSNDIHLRVISQDIPQPWNTYINLEIIFLKCYSNLPEANELNSCTFWNDLMEALKSELDRSALVHLYSIVESL